MERKYRVTSKVRFTVFLAVLIAGALLLVGSLFSIGTVRGESFQQYRVVKVQAGDTLWDIAGKYGSRDTDIRQSVDRIMQANDMNEPDDLQAGQEILVPEADA